MSQRTLCLTVKKMDEQIVHLHLVDIELDKMKSNASSLSKVGQNGMKNIAI